jgi:hypothetical protein
MKPTFTGACAKAQAKATPPSLEDYVERIFKENDADGSGELSSEELWWLFTCMGLGITEKDLFFISSKMDDDKVYRKRIGREREGGGYACVSLCFFFSLSGF